MDEFYYYLETYLTDKKKNCIKLVVILFQIDRFNKAREKWNKKNLLWIIAIQTHIIRSCARHVILIIRSWISIIVANFIVNTIAAVVDLIYYSHGWFFTTRIEGKPSSIWMRSRFTYRTCAIRLTHEAYSEWSERIGNII